MSSSVFKVYASSSRDGFESDAGSSGGIGAKERDVSDSCAVHEDLKIDSNLVILVNKDGSVSVDQSTLQSLLGNCLRFSSASAFGLSLIKKTQDFYLRLLFLLFHFFCSQ